MRFKSIVIAFTFFCFRFSIAANIDLKVSRETAAANVSIDFSIVENSVNVAPNSIDWDFGDGVTSKGQKDRSHSYLNEGEYEVKVNLLVANGKPEVLSQKISIVKNVPPTAEFYYWNKGSIVKGQEVLFISQATDIDSKLSSYDWIISNKNQNWQYSGKELNFQFATAGKYSILHNVTDMLGSEGQIVKTIEVKESNKTPVLNVDIPMQVPIGRITELKYSAKDSDGRIEYLTWQSENSKEFRVSGKKLEVAFSKIGANKLTIKAYDDSGGFTSVSRIVNVYDENKGPILRIKTKASEIYEADDVYFKLDIDGLHEAFTDVEWDFGDSSKMKLKDQTVLHPFAASGDYKVKATLTVGSKTYVSNEFLLKVKKKKVNRLPIAQVVLNEWGPVELALTQKIDVDLTAYDSDGNQITNWTTISWNVNNSNVSVVALSPTVFRVTGSSVGDTNLSVTIDGITSNLLIFKVRPFVNGAVLTKKGNYIGSERERFCFYINKLSSGNTVFYEYKNEYGGYPSFGLFEPESDYAGKCLYTVFPYGRSAVWFMAESTSPVEQYSASYNSFSFGGLKKYLAFRAIDSAISIRPTDERLNNWNEDFSITYWTFADPNGKVVMPVIEGKYKLSSINGTISGVLTDGTSSKKIFAPSGESFSDRWIHIGLVYKHSESKLKMYVDGALIGSITTPGGNFNLQSNVLFKSSSPLSAIDELRIWNKSLSISEITDSLYGTSNLSSNDLLAYFNFDDEIAVCNQGGESWCYRSLENASGKYSPFLQNVPLNVVSERPLDANLYPVIYKLPDSQYGSGKVEIDVGDTSYSPTEKLFVQIRDSIDSNALSKTPEGLYNSRVSQYFYLGGAESFGNGSYKIPIDTRKISSSDAARIKIIHMPFRTQGVNEFAVQNPYEINLANGYVLFFAGSSGYYWAAVPINYFRSAPNFTNENLSSILSTGERTFFVNVPHGTTSYTLTSESRSVGANYTHCLPNGYQILGGSHLTNFQQGEENSCRLSYTYSGGINLLGETVSYNWTDLVIVKVDAQ